MEAGHRVQRTDGRRVATEIILIPDQLFLQGRQYEQRVDASALRADEGRGIAAISVGEPRAGVDPTISEWGNPIVVTR